MMYVRVALAHQYVDGVIMDEEVREEDDEDGGRGARPRRWGRNVRRDRRLGGES